MTVRRGQYQDIPGVIAVMRDAHQRSVYAESATFDEEGGKHLISQSIHRHGQTNRGSSLLLVSEHEGEVKGFMLGYIDVVYPGLKEYMATDLLFLCMEDAPRRDPYTMLQQLIAWGQRAPRVIEIHLGISGALGDVERTGRLYEHAGLKRCGAMYRMEV